MSIKVFFSLIVILIYSCDFIRASDQSEERTFYFVRHGITDWAIDKVLEGPQDLPLNEQGKADIGALALTFKSLLHRQPTSILYSPLKRCEETMVILRRVLEIDSVGKFDDLQEVYRGDWSKLPLEDKALAKKHLLEKNYIVLDQIKVPDAEDWDIFINRITDVMIQCLAHDQKHPIIVTHGQVIKTFLKGQDSWLEDLSLRWIGDYRPPIKVSYKGQKWTAELI